MFVKFFETLKKARDEYYQYVQAQNDIFDKQIKLLDELQTTVCLFLLYIAYQNFSMIFYAENFLNLNDKFSYK